MTTPVALLDGKVPYPARLRDLLIRLAIEGVYRARWSERILDECFDNIAADRPDVVARAPDGFLLALATSDADAVVEVLTAQATALKNPPMSVDALLDGLVEIGVDGFVDAVRSSAL